MGIEALLQSQVIGLSDALAAKLGLTGGTLTGALNGTTISLSDRFDSYNVNTSATSYERGKFAWESNVLRIGTEKGSAGGSARPLELQTDGTTRITIQSSGGIVFNSYIGMNVTGNVFWNEINGRYTWGTSGQRSAISSSSDGVILLSNFAMNAFSRLQFGSTTSSYPAIKRSSASLAFRLADDSGDCDISAKAATFSGNVTTSAVNIVTDTTTGTKIGTGTTQKLGFWNATPVVQPTAVSDATDAASAITQLNALLSRMRTVGLLAT